MDECTQARGTAEIVDRCAERFLDRIRKITDIQSHMAIGYARPAFPILGIANKDYYEYKRFEGLLEWYTREELIRPVLQELLEETQGLRALWPDKGYIAPGVQSAGYADEVPFEFIIEWEGLNVGYRYDDLYADAEEFDTLMQQYGLSHIEIVHWEDESEKVAKSVSWGTDPDRRHLVRQVSVHDFLESFLSSEDANTVLAKLQKAVAAANDLVGFQTIPSLSLRYLSDFRLELAARIERYRDKEKAYIRKGTEEQDSWRLNDEDRRVIDENFFDKGLCKALYGTGDFAKCFITSEYLYEVFKNGGEFDYTAVVCGYLKSIEQLAYSLMKLTPQDEEQKLWIKKNSRNVDESTEVRKLKPYRQRRQAKHVAFTSENEQYFDTSLGSLANFLHENRSAWKGISNDGRHFVLMQLRAFTKECRNEHFHKDNIDELKEVGRIRTNAFFVAYLMLGGYCPQNEINTLKHDLGIKENRYDELYGILASIPKSVNSFEMRFGKESRMGVIRLYDQEPTLYDEHGHIVSKVRFVKVGDCHIRDYEEFLLSIRPEDIVEISPDNLPDKVWVKKTGGFKDVEET